MSGGQGRRDSPSLAERSIGQHRRSTSSAAGREDISQPTVPAETATPAAPAGAAPADTRPHPVGRRHCWVHLPDAPNSRFAGLVVAWAPADTGGWKARTIYVVDDGNQAVVVEAWIPAEHLLPL